MPPAARISDKGLAPRLLVEVRWGRLRGRKAIVAPAGGLRVGRTERADLVVPHDADMSSVHLEILWDGAVARLRDLASLEGTWLNGERVTEAEVAHGDWIRAGGTVITVHVEAKTPPPRLPIEDDEDLDVDERARRAALRAAEAERRARAADALRELQAEAARGPLYAVLDAARDPRILQLLREAPEEHRSLYEGLRGEALGDVAPYLVRLAEGSGLLERLVMEGWERRWGIYLACPLAYKDMRRHLRRFLIVETEDTRERLYFRFYDPGVLDSFLPTCTVRQVTELLGEAQAALCEDKDGRVRRFTKPAPGRAAATTDAETKERHVPHP